MRNKLFLPLILCILAACNDEAEYSGRVGTQQDLADCLKAGMYASIDYEKREGTLPQGIEDQLLALDDDWYLQMAELNISLIMMDPEESERVAKAQLYEYANGAWAAEAWEATCHLAYLTGQEVDWPDY